MASGRSRTLSTLQFNFLQFEARVCNASPHFSFIFLQFEAKVRNVLFPLYFHFCSSGSVCEMPRFPFSFIFLQLKARVCSVTDVTWGP